MHVCVKQGSRIPAWAGVTPIIETTVKLPLSSPACDDCCSDRTMNSPSRRTPGSSVFRRAPVDPADEKHIDSWNRAAIKKPARRPVEEEIKRAENKKHYQKASW
jgi:hypothetical protein